MFKRIFLTVAAILAVFLIYVAQKPSDFRVTRSLQMSAPPAAVFAQINDFHAWEAWSPWKKMDPAAKTTFEGPSAGTGAVYKWSGNRNVGEGMMTITESRPHELIRIKLDFIKPFPGTSTTEFTFKPEGPQTRVSWDMSGKNAFIPKIMCTFMDMDKMVGGEFDKGLADIKAIVERKRS